MHDFDYNMSLGYRMPGSWTREPDYMLEDASPRYLYWCIQLLLNRALALLNTNNNIN